MPLLPSRHYVSEHTRFIRDLLEKKPQLEAEQRTGRAIWWDKLPAELRTVVARHINAAGMKERADVAELNAGLQKELAAKGMAFNQPDAAAFRDQLRKAGFYSEWKAKYGDEAWALLERSAGKLA